MPMKKYAYNFQFNTLLYHLSGLKDEAGLNIENTTLAGTYLTEKYRFDTTLDPC
jgi:hypothetical protein